MLINLHYIYILAASLHSNCLVSPCRPGRFQEGHFVRRRILFFGKDQEPMEAGSGSRKVRDDETPKFPRDRDAASRDEPPVLPLSSMPSHFPPSPGAEIFLRDWRNFGSPFGCTLQLTAGCSLHISDQAVNPAEQSFCATAGQVSLTRCKMYIHRKRACLPRTIIRCARTEGLECCESLCKSSPHHYASPT